jgi:hypothetical protein
MLGKRKPFPIGRRQCIAVRSRFALKNLKKTQLVSFARLIIAVCLERPTDGISSKVALECPRNTHLPRGSEKCLLDERPMSSGTEVMEAIMSTLLQTVLSRWFAGEYHYSFPHARNRKVRRVHALCFLDHEEIAQDLCVAWESGQAASVPRNLDSLTRTKRRPSMFATLSISRTVLFLSEDCVDYLEEESKPACKSPMNTEPIHEQLLVAYSTYNETSA